jgi:cellulose synthase/poly-beta-1,6-N-acetylglucosamine synthase-like glycosyltransferase
MTVQRAAWTVVAPLGVCVLLAGWIAMSAVNFEAASFSIVVYGLANLIVYTDALDFVLRLYVHRRHTVTAREGDDTRDLSINIGAALPQGARRVVPAAPYAIIASVFNLEDDLDAFIEAFAPYRDRVWLVSDGSTDNTVMRLRRAGWRCLEEAVNRRKPAALRALLERLPDAIATIMVIDPDVRIRGKNGAGSVIDLERFISDFQLSGAAAACPRVMIEPDGFLARFQAFEYALAFRVGRASLSDFSLTSGGVSVYRRDALVLALQEHSLSVYAEDFENAIILLGHGERIYFDGRLVVSTEGPGSVSRWFSQRVGWYHGLLKVYTERFSQIWRISRRTPFAMYHFIIYIGVLSLGLHLLKVLSAALLVASFVRGLDRLLLDNWVAAGALTNPVYFTAAIGSYLALGVIALFTSVPKAERAYVAPIVPIYLFYAIAHIVPMSVGFANWIAVKLFGRRLYHDHYEPRPHGAIPEDGVQTHGRGAA